VRLLVGARGVIGGTAREYDDRVVGLGKQSVRNAPQCRREAAHPAGPDHYLVGSLLASEVSESHSGATVQDMCVCVDSRDRDQLIDELATDVATDMVNLGKHSMDGLRVDGVCDEQSATGTDPARRML
jgi:hypothetical protein